MKFKIDGFVITILITVLLAYLFPFFGTDQSPINIGTITNYGIGFIFLFYGLKLDQNKIKTDLSNWKLHLVVQLATFLLFPLLVLLVKPFVAETELAGQIWLAFYFMACLPSTVSSSVVMVALAKGNIPGAIFNASISGIIGIVLTPLWMGFFLQTSTTDFDFTDTYIDLIVQIIIPIVLGLFLQKYIGYWSSKYNKQLNYFDKVIILLIIYKSFAHAFSIGLFESVSVAILAQIFAGVVVLFAILYGVLNLVCKTLGFTVEDRITALFCGSKKSLVHGTVFSSVMFGSSAVLGIILLPIMIYHAFQIVIISFIAQKFANR
ncbi:bile acid:sodium symporter [Flavobacterium agricola]|uniref:Bile acid:sodium symporter n=1 Tax=Flavobacterium agricola TaxID=2870839 RepID=A0ABY6LVJ7_9FLAO|nr:bile acid:sodium symporter family protein [Flavobacterium agricola]UYW00352.1 bile acid:sodium symporter [Flavobacterium agricola]